MQELISEWMRRWQLSPVAWNFIILGAVILFSAIVHLLLYLFIRRKKETGDSYVLWRSVLRYLSGPLGLLIPLFIFDLFYPALRIPRAWGVRLDHILEITFILAFAWTLIRLIRAAQDFIHHRINIRTPNNLRQRRILTQLTYIRRVINVIIVLFTIGAVLLTFSTLRKIGTGLLTGVGISGIIVGFAAQRSLANLLAGFQIAFTQPIRIDDQVVVEEEFGTIEEITLTFVVVRIWDDRRLVLPINYFIEKPFQNWTKTTADVMGTIFIYADYALPVEPVRREFQRLAKEHPYWDGRAASLVVTDVKESTIELRGLVSCRNAGELFDLRCYLREHLIRYIQEQFPQALPVQRTAWAGKGREDAAAPPPALNG
ncbi:MAG TPA: mechanosensitive ion channel domain-containing protein [Chitinophagaceae bacterium]|jgi:small-conductance mechanosensitive channel|nr:mechanosensitive ion channel domain-containing protein [Chitinophagaceae bacterium]